MLADLVRLMDAFCLVSEVINLILTLNACMWAMWTPGGLSLGPPHICVIYLWCLGFQPRIFSIQRIIKNSLECLFHRDAGELFSLGRDLIYLVFVYGTGNVNEFLTI